MYYLSFDCANKSLGVILFEVDDYFFKKIKELGKEFNLKFENLNETTDTIINIAKDNLEMEAYFKFLKEMDSILSNRIRIKHLDVVNILGDENTKDVNILIRASKLKTVLNQIDKEWLTNISSKIKVIIEYQLNYNDKSRTVYNQLIYHFSGRDNMDVNVIAPAYKNKLFFSNELRYGEFVSKYNTNYKCNKEHSKANFLYFIDTFYDRELIKHIKNKNLDDIADSFMQAIAFIKFKCNT